MIIMMDVHPQFLFNLGLPIIQEFLQCGLCGTTTLKHSASCPIICTVLYRARLLLANEDFSQPTIQAQNAEQLEPISTCQVPKSCNASTLYDPSRKDTSSKRTETSFPMVSGLKRFCNNLMALEIQVQQHSLMDEVIFY